MVQVAVLVVNPFATRVSEEKIAAVEDELRRVVEISVVRTERPRHAIELVSEACADGCEAVIVFSGDGGFNEALNGLHGDVPIGFLPGGLTMGMVLSVPMIVAGAVVMIWASRRPAAAPRTGQA